MTDPTDDTGETAPVDAPAGSARDYIKAFVLIALIVGLVFLVFWIGIGGFCGCTTKGPG